MGMNFPVKWYDNSMGGCPRAGIAATAGSLVAYLDAVLVDGFNTITLDSVVIAGNVATATRSAGNHGFVPYQVIEIAGATPFALNGQWRVIDVTAQTFRFTTTGISDQTASGTITCKTPPLGWERSFSSGHKRVYRSPNTDECARSFFRFDDSAATNFGAVFTPYASMTDVDTGTGKWIHSAANNDSENVHRSYDSRHFSCGDDKTFYGVWQDPVYTYFDNVFAMGAFESYLPNDTDNDFYSGLMQESAVSSNMGYTIFSLYSHSSSNSFQYNNAIRKRAIRDVLCRGLPARWVNDMSGYGGPAYPEPFTNGLFVVPNLLRDTDYGGNPIRGRIRGTYWALQNQPMYCPIPGIDLDDVVGLEGRRVRLIAVNGSNGNAGGASYQGRGLFDITGPWD